MFRSSADTGSTNDRGFLIVGAVVVLGGILVLGGFFLARKALEGGGSAGGGSYSPINGGAPEQKPVTQTKIMFDAPPASGAAAVTPRAGAVQTGEQAKGVPVVLPQTDELAAQAKIAEDKNRRQQATRRQAQLRNARKLADKGQTEKAKASLAAIIREAPGTPEAEQAEALLKTIGNK